MNYTYLTIIIIIIIALITILVKMLKDSFELDIAVIFVLLCIGIFITLLISILFEH